MVIVWISGNHGAGKTTTSARAGALAGLTSPCRREGQWDPGVHPAGLPSTDNFQHWPPWRQLAVETAAQIADISGWGGT